MYNQKIKNVYAIKKELPTLENELAVSERRKYLSWKSVEYRFDTCTIVSGKK
jgi:hypothetical protein